MELWIEKPSSLFDVTKLKQFVPSQGMTWEENANTIIRFVFYLGIILYLFDGNYLMLLVPLVMVMAIQYYLYKENNQLKKYLEQFFGVAETFTMDREAIINSGENSAYMEDDTMFENTDLEMLNHMNKDGKPMEDDYASGQRKTSGGPMNDEKMMMGNASDDKMMIGNNNLNGNVLNENGMNGMNEMNGLNNNMNNCDMLGMGNCSAEPKRTIGPRPELALEREEPAFKPKDIQCKVSTVDNPFGNAMPYDSIDRQVTPVCPNEYEKDKNFYSGLFANIDDVFDRNNSQRQFTTNPSSTRINDQEAAIQFFYNTPYTEH